MAARSIASMTLSFGLVSVPVKVYTATESKSGVGFNLMHKDCGTRLKQQYVCPHDGKVVERADMVKGYEFEKEKYVIFEKSELEALEASASHTIDIVSFVPTKAIDPIYLDKPYYLAPDKRGGKPYRLLQEAMKDSGTCAVARWTWKGKQHMVQVRAGNDGLILQTLLYADEVRSQADIGIEETDIQPTELQLAEQLIEQYRVDSYDAAAYKDEEKERILAEIDKKIAGNKITAAPAVEQPGAQVIDLVEALRASLKRKPVSEQPAAAPRPARQTARATAPTPEPAEEAPAPKRRSVRRAAEDQPAPARKTGTKR
ncbi:MULTISPECIES: Ku protein [unclassified Caballeronia]|uniref:non-homologous end joining protein Ku n=1 Tax=unclassified Caballeronia TaxID=2646786 RepID=UPI002866AC75|nr:MULTISPECIES: Ku protein [unclassified Caballeronia]MDR5754888.1 Ku protein [Caballeronia sp. LZ024]MDR5845447.1 Ku protein [Caballeronia sp. LZ031]